MPSLVPTLDRFVARTRHLVSLPAVTRKILDLTSSAQLDLHTLKECIEFDPALTIRVLRAVHGSFVDVNRDVTDLNRALHLLDEQPLKLLVLGFRLSEATFTKPTGDAMLRYWRLALTRAIAARDVAKTVCRIPGEEAFVAALVQDVGVLALLQDVGEPYARILSRPFVTKRELAAEECEAFGFDHVELTNQLLTHWGLPAALRAVVFQSHAPPGQVSVPPSIGTMTRILQLASRLAELLVDERYDLLAALPDSGAAHGALTHPQFSGLVAQLREKMTRCADMFSLALRPGQDYREPLLLAHARMSDLTETLQHHSSPPVPHHTNLACEAASILEEVELLSSVTSQMIQRPAEVARVEFETPRVLARSPGAISIAGGAQTPGDIATCRPTTLKNSADEGVTELMNCLGLMIYACRESRWALSLALVKIDRFPQLVLKFGPQQAMKLSRSIHDACRALDVPQSTCVPLPQSSFALALPDCDRHQAARFCTRLLQEASHLAATDASRVVPQVTVSIGLASVDVPAKSFTPTALYDSASRCLTAAQRAGGNTLKSIRVY